MRALIWSILRKQFGVRLQSRPSWANSPQAFRFESTTAQEDDVIYDICKTQAKCALSVILLLVCLSVVGCGGGAGATSGGGGGNGGNGGGGGGAGGVSIASISPDNATAGSPDLKVTIQGSNFESIPGDIHMGVDWTVGGVSPTATSVVVLSSTQLTAVIPAALMAKPVVAEISVSKWHKADDTPLAVSNVLSFTVSSGSANSASISPPSATVGLKGSQQFKVSLDGLRPVS
jgi:IPT/TIG domain